MSIPQPEIEPPARPLPTPAALRARFPVSRRLARSIERTRAALRDVLHGRDSERLVVIAGPCSIHDAGAALEYARALAKVARETDDALVVLMRTYFDKPRTVHGWKGAIRDPFLDGSCRIAEGLGLARRLLCEIGELGLACASELLDPFTARYIENLLSWGVVGARTSESQTHRELASGLCMPVGFKNGMRGELEIARDALVAARQPDTCIGLDDNGQACVWHTAGNPDGHLVLRGGTRPNYSAADVRRALALLADQPLVRPIVVDCSHGNSRKDPTRQAVAFRDVLRQVAGGCRGVMGLMLESHLRPGRQDIGAAELAYGVSITDACIGWDETEQLLYEAAATVRARRGAR